MKSKKVFKLLQLGLVLVIAISVLSSCNNSKKKAEEKVEVEIIKQDIEEYAYPLISMFDVTEMLNNIEASYIVGIANDAASAESYFTEQSKAVNLGVYISDLAYAITYNQIADQQSYFTAIQKLITELDLTGAFTANLKSEIESKSDNNEAMVELVKKISSDAYSYLNRQNRKELSYLILAGSAIEGLYLSTHISENTLKNPKIIETILYQKSAIAKLESLMSKYADSEISKEAYAKVKAINDVYAMNESSTSMTMEQIEKLTSILDDIRTNSIQ